MPIFGRKKGEDYEEDDSELDVKDLKPEHRKKRKELPKTWGKRERYTVLVFLLLTVLTSAILAAASRSWKLPGLPELSFPLEIEFPSFDFLKGKTITVGPGKREVGPQLLKAEETIKEVFRKKTKELSGTYAFFIIDTVSGYSFGDNEDEVLTAASLIKLPLIAAIYIEAEQGGIKLDDKPSGSSLTFRELAEEMGKRSNNSAQITIANALGREKIKTVIDFIGMEDTSYAENETTAYDIGLFFQKVWSKEIVSEASRDEILSFLTDTIYEDWIKKGIPEVRVAHKYGRDVHVVSDAGIVFAERPFVLVVMTQKIVDAEADTFIPEFSALVFRELRPGS